MPHFTYANNPRRCSISSKSRVPVRLTLAREVGDYQVRVVQGQREGGGMGRREDLEILSL